MKILRTSTAYLTTKLAAEQLGVSPSRVRQFVMEKRLPAQNIGRQLVFQAKDVAAFERLPPGRKRSK